MDIVPLAMMKRAGVFIQLCQLLVLFVKKVLRIFLYSIYQHRKAFIVANIVKSNCL